MSMMLTGRRFKNCLPKNANGRPHRCRSISVRSIQCLLMNGRMFMNDTRNMMAATSVTMPCGSLVLWLFFTIGVFVIAGGIGMIIAKSCGK